MSLNIKRLQEKIDYGSSGGSGGIAIKTKTYTGTGTNSNVIEFEEKPKFILGIGVVSEATYYVNSTSFPFSNGKFKVFSSDGTEYDDDVSVSGNTMTITGQSKLTAFNDENTTYMIIYAV